MTSAYNETELYVHIKEITQDMDVDPMAIEAYALMEHDLKNVELEEAAKAASKAYPTAPFSLIYSGLETGYDEGAIERLDEMLEDGSLKQEIKDLDKALQKRRG